MEKKGTCSGTTSRGQSVQDAEGQEVPFNKGTLNQLLEVRGFATAVGFAFMESNEEIFVKN